MKSCHTSRVNLIKSSVCSLYLFGPFSFSFYHPSPHSSPLHTQPFIFHPLLIPPFSFTLSSLYFTFSTSFTFTHLTIPYLFPSTFLLHFLFLLFIYFPYLSHSFLFYFYFLYSHSFMYTSFSFLYSSSTYPSFYFFTILYFLPYLFPSTYFPNFPFTIQSYLHPYPLSFHPFLSYLPSIYHQLIISPYSLTSLSFLNPSFLFFLTHFLFLSLFPSLLFSFILSLYPIHLQLTYLTFSLLIFLFLHNLLILSFLLNLST